MGELVVLDYDEACDGEEGGEIVQSGVRVCALFLLLCGVGGLEDQDSLEEEEEGGGVEERVGGEEDEVVAEDGAPDYGDDLGGVRLGWLYGG